VCVGSLSDSKMQSRIIEVKRPEIENDEAVNSLLEYLESVESVESPKNP